MMYHHRYYFVYACLQSEVNPTRLLSKKCVEQAGKENTKTNSDPVATITSNHSIDYELVRHQKKSNEMVQTEHDEISTLQIHQIVTEVETKQNQNKETQPI